MWDGFLSQASRNQMQCTLTNGRVGVSDSGGRAADGTETDHRPQSVLSFISATDGSAAHEKLAQQPHVVKTVLLL